MCSKDRLRELERIGKFLLLLIDDFDAAIYSNQEYPDQEMQQFLSECRKLAIYSGREISMIVTSKKRLNEINTTLFAGNQSPWYNHYLFEQIKPFDDAEIEQLFQPFNKQVESADRQLLNEITGGNPYLLQIAGSLIYREINTKQLPDLDNLVQNFESSTQQFFDSIWKLCSKNEQILLMLMALSKLKGRLHDRRKYDLKGVEQIFSQHGRVLRNLEEQGVIKKAVNNDTIPYLFTSSLMEKSVIHEIWNSNEDALINRQKEFLNLMSHQQTESMKNGIIWVGNHKNDVTSALKFIYPILGKIFKLLLP